jgi:hypothetical protein
MAAGDRKAGRMQEASNLESVFVFLYGTVLGRQVCRLANAQPGERVVVLREPRKGGSVGLPELPVSDLTDEVPLDDPLPIVDIFDYASTGATDGRLAHGWDVLVAGPEVISAGSGGTHSLVSTAATSASRSARAILMLPVGSLNIRRPVKELLVHTGHISTLVFTSNPPPRSMGMPSSMRFVIASWTPRPAAGALTNIVGLDRAGKIAVEFNCSLNPSRPWSLRGLDPREAEKLDRWAAKLQAVELTEVADVLKATRVDAAGVTVLHPEHITSSGIDLAAELPDKEDIENPSRLILLQRGDLVGRSLGPPHWALITDEFEAQLAAHPQVLAIRPKQISSEVLLAFLHSDVATQQLVPEQATIPRIRNDALRTLRVPTVIPIAAPVVEEVREFRRTSERLASDLESRYRTAFDSADEGTITQSLDDAATEATLALELLRRATDPLQRARQFLPHPLARTLRSYDNDRVRGSAQETYANLLRFGETAITILGIVGLSYTTSVLGDEVHAGWARSLKRGVSLGTWLECANDGAKAARTGGEPLGGLAAALSTKSPLNNALEAFLTARQHQAHGGGPRSPYEFERERAELEEHLSTCIEELVPLARSEWFIASSLHWSGERNDFRVVGRSLRGEHPDFDRWEMRRTDPLESGVVYAQLGTLVVPLVGYCQLRSCPECLHEELYYPDKSSGSMIRLRSLDRGHQAEIAMQESRLPATLWSP